MHHVTVRVLVPELFGPEGALSGTIRPAAELDVEIMTFAGKLEADRTSFVAAGYVVIYMSLFWTASVFLSTVELA